MGASSFNEMEIDAIGEIMNISLGASATAVSTMLGTTVNITTPVVRVLYGDEFEFKNLEPAVGVEISYTQGLEGSNIMMFSRNDVRIIVSMLMGAEIPEEQFELDEINRSAICEVMNQMMGSSATALSEFLGVSVNISTPISFEVEDEIEFKDKYFPTEAKNVVVRFSLEVEGKLKSEFLNIMSVELAKRLLAPFAETFGQMQDSQNASGEASAISQESENALPEQQEPAQSGSTLSQEEIQKLMQDQAEPEGEHREAPQADRLLSQEEIQKMMQGQTEPEEKHQEAPDRKLSQEEIQKMMQGQGEMEMSGQTLQPAQQMDGGQTQQMAQPAQQMAQPQPQMAQQPVYGTMPQPVYQAAPDPMMFQILSQMQQSQMQMVEMMREMKSKEKQRSPESSVIHPIHSTPMDDDGEPGVEDHANQEMLMKVPLEVSVEIGRTKKRVKDILEFTQGSLVVLDKMAGEQADLYVNGQCIARGDIVVVEDNFGIRITEIVARNLNPESL